MSEQDSLSTFDWGKVTGGGLYIKFEAGKPLTLRILTTDPVVSNDVYEDKETGEETITTKFAFICYNFTDKKAQILKATPNMARKIGELHVDPDFGANIKSIDIKISPTGEKLLRRYDIQVLPKTNTLTNEQIKEAQAIKLDEQIKDGERMHMYDPDKKTGLDKAREVAESLRPEEDTATAFEDEELDISSIPF